MSQAPPDTVAHEGIFASPRPSPLASLVVAIGVGLLTCFFFTPRFVCFLGVFVPQRLPFPEIHRAFDTLPQLRDPWLVPDTPSNGVIVWRLFFPLIWYWLHLPVWLYLIMPAIGCVLALWLATWLVYKRLRNWPQTALAVLLFAALPWFFVATGWLTYFDSWLMIGLLTVGFIHSRPALAATCLVMPWIDERFVLALPVTLAARVIAFRTIEDRQWRSMLIDIAVIVVASLPYPAMRVAVWLHDDPVSSAYVDLHRTEIQSVPLSRFAAGLWSGFRAAWLMVLAAVWFWGRRAGWAWGACLGLLVLVTSLGALCIAADMSRTFTIEVPLLLAGLWLWHECSATSFRFVLPLVVAANFLLPATHVVWPFEIPIRYFYVQVDAYREPPRELQPQTYVAESNLLLEQRNFAAAAIGFDSALQLDKNYLPAYVGRATLHFMERRIPETLSDVEAALRLQPGHCDALFVRALVRQVQGNRLAAVADLEQASQTAPENWPLRAEAQRLLEQFRGEQRPAHPAAPNE